MAGPKHATTSARGGRTYKIPTDQGIVEVPSVTTILNVVAKPAIAGWAAKAVAQYAVANHDILTSMLERGQQEDAIKLLKGSPWTTRDTAADVGTRVHKLIESHIFGGTPEPDEQEAPYWQSYLAFRQAYPNLEFLSSELTVYDLALGYAGTMDAIVMMNGQRGILDWKTRQGHTTNDTFMYETEGLQLAAYAYASRFLLDDGSTGHLEPVEGATVVMLCTDGFKLGPADLEADWQGFQSTLDLYRWKQARFPR
jgi:hypothetical protein